MIKIRVIDREGQAQQIDAQPGGSLMLSLRGLEHGVEAICGGMMSCATCHVYVDPDWYPRLPAASEEEQDLLEELDSARANSRLSCQVQLSEDMDGLVLEIAPEE